MPRRQVHYCYVAEHARDLSCDLKRHLRPDHVEDKMRSLSVRHVHDALDRVIAGQKSFVGANALGDGKLVDRSIQRDDGCRRAERSQYLDRYLAEPRGPYHYRPPQGRGVIA